MLVAASELELCRDYRKSCSRQQQQQELGGSSSSSGSGRTWLDRGAELWSRVAPCPNALGEATSMERIALLAAACSACGLLWQAAAALVAGKGHAANTVACRCVVGC